MKTIKDAVIELGGKWPSKNLTKSTTETGWYITPKGTLTHKSFCLWINKSDFVSLAKKMDRIKDEPPLGKYEWGKEYPTNGKRPVLADDVICEVLDEVCGWCIDEKEGNVGTWKWFSVKAFRITDPRYKPADEVIRGEPSIRSELNLPVDEQEYEPVIITGADIAVGGGGGGFMPKAEPYFPPEKTKDEIAHMSEGDLRSYLYGLELHKTINKAEYVSEISKSKDFEMNVSAAEQNNSWHERGELPSFGDKFILKGKHSIDRDEREAEVTYSSNQNIVFNLFNQYGEVSNEICYSLSDFDARYIAMPIRTHREKVIEAVDSLIHDYQAGAEIRTEFLNVLYDSGMLVLPQYSGDTKD